MSSKKAKTEMHSEAQAQVANFAQKTVDQAQAAFEKVSEVAHSNVQIFDEAANAYKNRVTDIQLKTMEFAQLNLNAGFAFARKFVAVRDPAEAMTLQQAFFKEQAETLQRQAAELERALRGARQGIDEAGAGDHDQVLRRFLQGRRGLSITKAGAAGHSSPPGAPSRRPASSRAFFLLS